MFWEIKVEISNSIQFNSIQNETQPFCIFHFKSGFHSLLSVEFDISLGSKGTNCN